LLEEQRLRGRFGLRVVLRGVSRDVARAETVLLEVIGEAHELQHRGLRREQHVGDLELGLLDASGKRDLALAGQKRRGGDLTEVAVNGIPCGSKGAGCLDGVHDVG
jgi:hypothetical protein